ncbi:hypothetical protein MR730_06210, partial [bacterium]|nr:hypothetical protein [bacterium]
SEATVGIRSPRKCRLFAKLDKKQNILENGLPHQSADWFAMAGFSTVSIAGLCRRCFPYERKESISQ